MPLPPAAELTSFFHKLCDAAAAATLPLFRSKLGVVNKLDAGFDPVTEADRDAERAIRALIEKHYPDHGIVGEEFGTARPDASLQWIIDPIDGTRAFISGIPVWGTLIGLYEDGVPVAGAMDQPFTRERYMSVDGVSLLKVGDGDAIKKRVGLNHGFIGRRVFRRHRQTEPRPALPPILQIDNFCLAARLHNESKNRALLLAEEITVNDPLCVDSLVFEFHGGDCRT